MTYFFKTEISVSPFYPTQHTPYDEMVSFKEVYIVPKHHHMTYLQIRSLVKEGIHSMVAPCCKNIIEENYPTLPFLSAISGLRRDYGPFSMHDAALPYDTYCIERLIIYSNPFYHNLNSLSDYLSNCALRITKLPHSVLPNSVKQK